MIRVKDYDEALAVANATPFGLSAGHRDDVAEAREPLQAQLDERPGDGEPADGGSRLSRAVWRPEEIELRPARAGRRTRKEFYTIVKTAYVSA